MTRNQIKQTQEFKERLHDKWAEAGGTISKIPKSKLEKSVLDEMIQEMNSEK